VPACGVLLNVDSEELDLVLGLRRGEPAAFNCAYGKYRARVYGFLLRLCGRRDVADDLLQETWMKLARHAPSLRADTTLLPWLLAIARNRFLSYRRWSILDITRLLSFGVEQNAAFSESPEERSEATARVGRLERALAGVPTASREVLLLVCVDGMEQEHVAEIVGISYAALRQRLSRARGELLHHLEVLEKNAPRNRPEKKPATRGAT